MLNEKVPTQTHRKPTRLKNCPPPNPRLNPTRRNSDRSKRDSANPNPRAPNAPKKLPTA